MAVYLRVAMPPTQRNISLSTFAHHLLPEWLFVFFHQKKFPDHCFDFEAGVEVRPPAEAAGGAEPPAAGYHLLRVEQPKAQIRQFSAAR